MDCFLPADILLPKEGVDLQKWAALACDQFTSQPEYWQEAEDFVGDAPSMLHLMLPEVYLEAPDVAERTRKIHADMAQALEDTLLTHVDGYLYVERTMESGAIRQGIVGCVDLEAYSYERGAQCAIRPSENTVLERIPPRLAVRRDAPLESPHILMLIDDPAQTVIEPVAAAVQNEQPIYDVELMLGGGRLRGWSVPANKWKTALSAALCQLGNPEQFKKKYALSSDIIPFIMAVGDGNHSLASAKALWEEVKPTLAEEERENHPARFCLLELENVQSDAIEIESIHRVITGIDAAQLKAELNTYAGEQGMQLLAPGAGQQDFTLVWQGGQEAFSLQNPPHPLAAGSFEAFYAWLEASHSGLAVDYIHGIDTVESLAAQGAIGFILPDFAKDDLFRGVALGGTLPKKTFSMGHAREKRYYMECRKIRK